MFGNNRGQQIPNAPIERLKADIDREEEGDVNRQALPRWAWRVSMGGCYASVVREQVTVPPCAGRAGL